jgi:Cu(I)/Ag(I) efflux system protein CusF
MYRSAKDNYFGMVSAGSFGRISMKLGALPPAFASSLLFVLALAACANSGPVATAPPPGSALFAVDLGGSSRIARVAGRAGEGEGYGTIQPASTDHASMAGMNHDVAKPTVQASMPGMDHGAPGHGSTSSMSQLGSSQSPDSAPPQVAQAGGAQGSGLVNSVDPSGHKINLSHGAIPAIGFPAMTMDFAVVLSVELGAIKPGAHVNFTLRRSGDGMYVIQSVTPAGGGH